jgi:hypothetical protein
MSDWNNNNPGWGGGDARATVADSWGGAAASTAASGWETAPANNDSDWNGGVAAISGGVENMNFGDNGANEGATNEGGDRACYNCGQPG